MLLSSFWCVLAIGVPLFGAPVLVAFLCTMALDDLKSSDKRTFALFKSGQYAWVGVSLCASGLAEFLSSGIPKSSALVGRLPDFISLVLVLIICVIVGTIGAAFPVKGNKRRSYMFSVTSVVMTFLAAILYGQLHFKLISH